MRAASASPISAGSARTRPRRLEVAGVLAARKTLGDGLANSTRQAEHENQHLRHRLVQFGRNFIAELDMGERTGENLVLLDRNVMSARQLDDLLTDASPALGNDPRRARPVVMQRYRELVLCFHAHNTRSRKCPARADAACVGAPARITMSPGRNSARLSA